MISLFFDLQFLVLVACFNQTTASDAPSFEMAPLVGTHNAPGGIWANESWEEEMQGGGLLHQWLLGGWGVMIGEMFDLEALCEKSVELGRSTCFVSSVPLKVCKKFSLLIGCERLCEDNE